MTIERLMAFGDAWNRGDVDDIMSYFAAECTDHASAGPEPGRTYQGREAVRRGVIEMLAWPMNTEWAFALTPADIISEAHLAG